MPVVALRPVDGAHVYVSAPDAVSVFDDPIHKLPAGLIDVDTLGGVQVTTILINHVFPTENPQEA